MILFKLEWYCCCRCCCWPKILSKLLLSFSLLNAETDLTAGSQIEYVKSVLKIYGKDLNFISFISGDNCNLNKRIANIINVLLVGCASHRYNLAVESFLMKNYENKIKCM